MSRIFDALQRSEAEQSEIDLSSGTTEVLKRSERRAANMSRIFDALQRSEAEQSEIDLSSGTTEVLQRSERRAATKWETTVLSEQHNAAKSVDRGTSFSLPEVMPVAMAPENSTAAKLSPTEEHLDPFAQFQSLQ